MPRYFFHVRDGVSIPDETGTELATLAEARREAVRLSGAILSESPDRVWEGEEWRMDVANEAGLILFVLHFSAVEAPAAARAGPDAEAPAAACLDRALRSSVLG